MSQIIDYFQRNRTEILALISNKGDPSFTSELAAILAQVIEKLIIYYFHIYHQEKIFRDNQMPFKMISMRYAKSVLSPIYFWLLHSDFMSVSELKKIIGETIIYSPYDLSTYRF